MNRVLGIEDSGERGPLIILLGGVHGNEETGVHAIVNVLRTFEEWNLHFHGKVVGLLGNLRAYEKGLRYLDYDLNRCWTDRFVEELKEKGHKDDMMAEDLELLDLLSIIEKESEGNFTEKILVDLHATSSDNGNFLVIPADEADHPVVNVLRLPIIIDLERYLHGTLLEYMHHRGFTSFAFEGGMIGSDKALDLHTSGVWEIIFASGMMNKIKEHEFSKYDDVLESFVHEFPHKVSVLYRHKINRGDDFKMRPGYYNFKPVKRGEIVAKDVKGDIRIREDGLIFMPLYQDLGDDGFFIVKEIEGRI